MVGVPLPVSTAGAARAGIATDIASPVKAGGNVVPLPKSVTDIASQASTTPKPIYSGPSIGSIPHLAESFGAEYKYDPNTGTVHVNGTQIPSTSSTAGVPNGRVQDVALASGHSISQIQPTKGGNVQVMPRVHVQNPPTLGFNTGETPQQHMSAYSAANTPTHSMASVGNPTGLGGQGMPQYLQTQHNIAASTPHPNGNPAGLPTNPGVPQGMQTQYGVNAQGQSTQPLSAGQLGAALGGAVGGVNLPPSTLPQSPVNAPISAPSTQTGQTPLNNYWNGVQKAGGLWQAPQQGESASQLVARLAQQFGLQPGQIHVNSAGHAFIPWNSIANYAATHSALSNAATSTGASGSTGNAALDQAIAALLSMAAGNQNPYPAQIAGLPQPTYSFDPNQAMQQALAMENPVYQAQIAAQNQIINDGMNRRGIYDSGIAQQAVDSADQGIYGKMDSAMMKDFNTMQANAINQYKAQLQAYADHVTALYHAGQMTDQQFAHEITAVNDAMTQLNKADATQAGLTKAELPYTQGPTPQQQIVDGLNNAKLALGQAYKNGQLSIQQYNAETTRLNDLLHAYEAGGTTIDMNGNPTPTVAAGKLTIEQQTQVDKELANIGLGYDPATGKIVQSVNGQKVAIDMAKLSLSQFQAIDKALGQIGLGLNPTNGQIESSLQATNDANNYAIKQAGLSLQQFNDVNKALNQIGLGINPNTGKVESTLAAGKLTLQQQQAAEKALNSEGLSLDPTAGKVVSTLTANNDAFNQWYKQQTLLNATDKLKFQEWAQKQGVLEKWASLSEKQREAKVTEFQNQEKINNTAANNNAKNDIANRKLNAQIGHWAKQDQSKSFEDALKQHSLREKIAHDNKMIDLATQRITDSQNKETVTGLHDQLSSLSSYLTTSGTDPNTVDPNAVQKYGPDASGWTYSQEYAYLMSNITHVISNQSTPGSSNGNSSKPSSNASTKKTSKPKATAK